MKLPGKTDLHVRFVDTWHQISLDGGPELPRVILNFRPTHPKVAPAITSDMQHLVYDHIIWHVPLEDK